MISSSLLLLLFLNPLQSLSLKYFHGHGFSQSSDRVERVTTHRPRYSSTTTPSSIDWRSVDGVSYVSTSRNQHNPNYCGACWSFAATSALSDRFRIASSSSTSHGHPASIREINPSMQVILNCDTYDNGCHGGDPLTAYRYIHENGIPEETCQLYEATGHDVVSIFTLSFSIC